MATIDNILSKAQIAAAKTDLRNAVKRELGNEISAQARTLARKFVKTNLKEIAEELTDLYAKELKANYARIVKEAVKNVDIHIRDSW